MHPWNGSLNLWIKQKQICSKFGLLRKCTPTKMYPFYSNLQYFLEYVIRWMRVINLIIIRNSRLDAILHALMGLVCCLNYQLSSIRKYYRVETTNVCCVVLYLLGVGFSGILVPGTRKYFSGQVSDIRFVNSLKNSKK